MSPLVASLRTGAVSSVAVIALLVSGVACSSGGSDGAGAADTTAEPAEGEESLFDPTVVADLDIAFDEDEFDEMVATYESTGDKAWIEATVTVDGTVYEHAGVRLKGNSSLRGISESAAEELPWLVRLDKFVEDQTHQGYEDIVVRSNATETSLNEAVALDLLDAAGLASVAAAPARLSVNGSDPELRLIVEHPDDDAWYEETFENLGALYKSESTGDWTYRGDDPAAYDEVFDQEGGSEVTDLTPLIEFLDFVNSSDDETFAAELSEHLDVGAFTTYLAMMELLDNFDDIDGPGNNSYLWWDAETERFTVVPWDLNLAFGVSPGGGGAPPGAGGPPPGGGGFGGRPPGEGTDQGERGPGGGFGRTNPLVERFHEADDLEAGYSERLAELREELFESGTAQELLDARTEVLLTQATDLVDEETIRSESETIAAKLR